MDTKQLEAIRIAEWLEGIRGRTWPSCTPQEAAAELRRLQSENEQLRAGYDAARQAIASLQAQPVAVKPSLSYDTARCPGNADKLLCQTCLRLLAPGNPYGQWFMTPPASIERGECASRIPAVRLQPILPSTNGVTHNA